MFSFFKRWFQKSHESLEEALRNGAVIVDVRTEAEFERGHIAGSKNIPLTDIQIKADMIRKWNKPVVTVCRSGLRSAVATKILKAAGINVFNGGAWDQLNAGQG